MRITIFLLFFACSANLTNAQDLQNNNILNIPRSYTNSTTDIAAYVSYHLEKEGARAHAIYYWVTENIRYDKDSTNIINSDIDPQARITAALRRRKGVCENFAAIFNDICVKAGVASFVVSGYTKQSGVVDKTGHSWCAVYVDSNWSLCDPTWDAGNGLHSRYFLAKPEEFIESHMPFDPLWQLLNYPVSHEQFYSGSIYRKSTTPYFNFSDSVTAYAEMDSMQKLRSAARRIQNYTLYNSLVKDNFNYVKMNIEIIGQDRDLELYNASMNELNDATTILNNFIEYRNNQFIPAKSDAELEALLNGVDDRVDSSLKKLDEVDKSKSTLTLGTEPVRERLNALSKKIALQKDFLKRYLNTDKGQRQSLFY